jgi:hypothetical protein
MSLPPCVCPDPHGPSGCTCVRPRRQWAGHSHAGPSTLFANSSRSTAGPSPIPLPQIALTTSHHAPHEPHASHESRDFHGTRVSKFKYSKHSISTHTIQQHFANSYLSISIPLLSPFAPCCTCRTSSNSFAFKRSKTQKQSSRTRRRRG